jgi:hypothetical protein
MVSSPTYDSRGRRYFGSVSEYKDYLRSIDRTRREEPTPGKATITRERVVTDPLTGEITRRETTFGGTELEIKERSPKTGKLEVVSRDFAPRKILPYIRAERQGNNASKMTVRDLQEIGYTPREAVALYRQEQRRMTDRELDRNIRLGEKFARGRGTFLNEEERIIGQAYATGRPVQIDENLIERFQKKYGKKEGTAKALDVIRKTADVAYVASKKPLRGFVEIRSKETLKPMSSKIKEKTQKYIIPTTERAPVQESRSIKLNNSELKTFRKEYFKEDINRYKVFARAQGYKIYFDNQGYVLKDKNNNTIKDYVGKIKPKVGTIDWAYVAPLKELSKKIKSQAISGKFGGAVQLYTQKTQTVRGSSGQKVYLRPGGFATKAGIGLAGNFLAGYTGAYAATKLALNVPSVARALKASSGALTTLYVGGVGYNVYRDRKDPKKVVVTLAKESAMLAGMSVGSRMAKLRYLRPNKADYEIQKNVFGRTYTNKLPSKKTLTRALNSAQTPEARDRILMSIYRTVGAKTGRFPVVSERLIGVQRKIEIEPGMFKEKIRITSKVISKKEISFVKKLPKVKNQIVVSGSTLGKITTKNASLMINKRGYYRITFKDGEPFVLEKIKESAVKRIPGFKKGLTQQAQRRIISKNQKELQVFTKRYKEIFSKINKINNKPSLDAQDRINKAKYNDILKRIQFNIRNKQKEIFGRKKKIGLLPEEKRTFFETEKSTATPRAPTTKIITLKPYKGKAKLKEKIVDVIKTTIKNKKISTKNVNQFIKDNKIKVVYLSNKNTAKLTGYSQVGSKYLSGFVFKKNVRLPKYLRIAIEQQLGKKYKTIRKDLYKKYIFINRGKFSKHQYDVPSTIKHEAIHLSKGYNKKITSKLRYTRVADSPLGETIKNKKILNAFSNYIADKLNTVPSWVKRQAPEELYAHFMTDRPYVFRYMKSEKLTKIVGQIKKLQLKYPKKTKKQLEAMGVIFTKAKTAKNKRPTITLKQL